MVKRRRGGGRGRARGLGAFERLVERALDRIPAEFQPALREVAIVIDDWPTPAQQRENGLGPDEALYGLYEGVPRTEYAADWVAAPNKITLFRIPLLEDFPDPRDLEDEVRITVVHELAHHLGIDDDRLEAFGLD
jgi:predicted Zn-dependent protease with MMP-like domain